jgi:hypothetical protein
MTTFFPVSLWHATVNGESYLLKKVYIEGNRTTGERFIQQKLTLEEGRIYEIEDLIDEINKSKTNLEKTGLFSKIFFNDEPGKTLSETTPVYELTIRIKLFEKNYFFFGPGGYLGFEKGEIYSNFSLYASYTNVFGNGTQFYSEIPVYQNRGIAFEQRGKGEKVYYNAGFEYRDDRMIMEKNWTMAGGIGFSLKEHLLTGMDIHLHHSDSMNSTEPVTSIIIYPYLEHGSHERSTQKQKRWHYVNIRPIIGYNFKDHFTETNTSFLGIEGRFEVFYDLLLNIIYTPGIYIFTGTGEFPKKYLAYSTVRGTLFTEYTGNYLLSITNELNVPLPTNPRYVFVPFIDTNLIGDGGPEFLAGGGIGLRLYTRFQDPLIIDLAFGKGIMINFQSRIK